MMDNLLNSQRSANCFQQLEKTEEKKEEMDTGEGSVVVEEKVEKMECEDEFDDTGLDGASTVSSSLLDSPARRTEVDPPVDPPGNNGNPLPNPEEPLKDPAPVPVDPVKGKRKKPGKLKMTNAQRRRCDHYMRRGFSSKEARELARLPVERPYLNKRQRSEEVASPNTSGRSKGPDNKRFRDRGSAGPAPPPAAQVGMISYKEVAQATHIAVTPVGYPATTLTTEQLKAVRINLLNLIINLKTPVIRPKYRNCTFKHGYLILACVDKATADRTKKAVGDWYVRRAFRLPRATSKEVACEAVTQHPSVTRTGGHCCNYSPLEFATSNALTYRRRVTERMGPHIECELASHV